MRLLLWWATGLLAWTLSGPAHAAFVTVSGEFYWGLTPFQRNTPVVDSYAMVAATDKVAAVFIAPATCTVDRIVFRTAAVTTSDTLRGSIQLVPNTTGNPDGTPIGSTGTLATPAADTLYEITVSSSVTRGTTYGAVIDFNSFVAGSLNIAAQDVPGGGAMQSFPYVNHFTASAWAKANASLPLTGIRCSTGTYYSIGAHAAGLHTTATITNATTPDEVGNVFTPTMPMKVSGVSAMVEGDGDFEVVLYTGAGTELTKAVFDSTVRAQTGVGGWVAPFNAEQTLSAGSSYRLVFRPTATANLNYSEWSVLSTAMREQLPFGAAFKTSRTDAGSWTDTATTTQVYGLALRVSALDDGAGVGSSGGGAMTCFEPSASVVGLTAQFPGTATSVTAAVLDPDDTTTASFTPAMSAVGSAAANLWRAASFVLPANPVFGVWTIQFSGTVAAQTATGTKQFEVAAQCPLKPGTAGRKLTVGTDGMAESNVEKWHANAVPTENSAGYPIVTVKDGTATGEIDTASGQVIASSVQGNVTGNVQGSVGSVTGAVGSIAAGGITAPSFGAGAIDLAALASDVERSVGYAAAVVVAASPAPTTRSFSSTSFTAATTDDYIGLTVNCGDGYKKVERFDPATDQIFLPRGADFGAAPTGGATCYLRWP